MGPGEYYSEADYESVDCEFDPAEPVAENERRLRACQELPVPLDGGPTVYATAMERDGDPVGEVGEVSDVGLRGVVVTCTDGSVFLTRLFYLPAGPLAYLAGVTPGDRIDPEHDSERVIS